MERLVVLVCVVGVVAASVGYLGPINYSRSNTYFTDKSCKQDKDCPVMRRRVASNCAESFKWLGVEVALRICDYQYEDIAPKCVTKKNGLCSKKNYFTGKDPLAPECEEKRCAECLTNDDCLKGCFTCEGNLCYNICLGFGRWTP